MTKYRVVSDGEWVRPRRRGYRLACCDCGLIHRINFRLADGEIEFQAFREPQATGGKRRAMGVTLTEKPMKTKMPMKQMPKPKGKGGKKGKGC